MRLGLGIRTFIVAVGLSYLIAGALSQLVPAARLNDIRGFFAIPLVYLAALTGLLVRQRRNHGWGLYMAEAPDGERRYRAEVGAFVDALAASVLLGYLLILEPALPALLLGNLVGVLLIVDLMVRLLAQRARRGASAPLRPRPQHS